MNIAIIANDKKKELITEFCIAYCGVLANHNICATAITGKYISEATGLTIERLLAGSHGGAEQIASKIAYDEVDLLILLRDTNNDAEYAETELNIVKLCDKYSVPVATNVATAEALVLALARGDLDWRANLKNGANRL
ncbi:MAG: methylglyoxal synthase [Clostridia bacterium]|nr:methylglyoxal synthase [Clostridia bacterium]MBR6754503.1 methylglyoxal synthase [Clostridia bacterium]